MAPEGVAFRWPSEQRGRPAQWGGSFITHSSQRGVVTSAVAAAAAAASAASWKCRQQRFPRCRQQLTVTWHSRLGAEGKEEGRAGRREGSRERRKEG